ncbi:cell division protein FtsQ/DivIB [Celeribacter marinus]|uniref:cell division protein FtsQ/DivIB n=1 Tax=Celeribacter marinus TaxID=1397108 RepID=UPI0031823DCE
MQPINSGQFRPAPLPPTTARRAVDGGSALVSEAVARVMGGRSKSVDAPALPRDPAPSRTAYRMSRLWLTPSFRFFMRRMAPVLGIAACVAIWFADADHRQSFADSYGAVKREVQNRPEFMVKLMAVDGVSDGLAQTVRDVAHVEFPVSSFELDLEGMMERIEGLDAVADVGLRVRAGGILQVDVTERVPTFVWRGPNGLELLDHTGHRVAQIDSRLEFPNLPLVAGEGANIMIAQAASILRVSGPILPRVRGLMRIGERRWDIVLDHGQTILLPEKNPIGALAQVIALDQAQDLLDRDVTHVDLRNPSRPTLRLTEIAHDDMRKIKGLELGVSFQ